MRYCAACYRPTEGENVQQAHTGAAQEVGRARRTDPTIVFLPDEHEAIERRRARRRRLIVGACGILLLVAGALVLWLSLGRESAARRQEAAREEMARRELNMLAGALEQFRLDAGRYPTDQEGLRSLTRRSFSESQIRTGPYLDGVYEVDPWGSDYVYRAVEGGEGFVLFSYGPAGEAGGQVYIIVTSPN